MKLSHPPESRLIDRVIVKGKSVPLDLIEIRHPACPCGFSEIAKVYDEAFALYQERKLREAEGLFRAQSQSDKPSRILAQRCAELSARIRPPIGLAFLRPQQSKFPYQISRKLAGWRLKSKLSCARAVAARDDA